MPRTALLGMPGYQGLTTKAARGFYRAATGGSLAVQYVCADSSLLAQNMNILWCAALNAAARGAPVDLFAMQHSDIEPEENWLELLVAEMDATGLDVLGVVSPIKDHRGVTSVAVGRADGDPWRVDRRLTMTEVYALPQTFTSADVGGPLLLNTGLWACRFDPAWAKGVHFEVNDRIVWSETARAYCPEVEPEDWNLSRQFHRLGLKVGCTRGVRLEHRGSYGFPNGAAWGTQETDAEYGRVAGGFVFPEAVPGWLSAEEGEALWRLARGMRVLEVGSYCGRSTVCLAQSAAHVTAVDTFDGRGTPAPGDTRAAFDAALAGFGVAGRVEARPGRAEDVLPRLRERTYDLAFIDGAHDRASVARDAALAAPLLRPGGLLAFHDYRPGDPADPDPGVAEAVGEILAAGGELLARAGSVAVVRPAPARQFSLTA